MAYKNIKFYSERWTDTLKERLLPEKLKELRSIHGYTLDYVAAALDVVRQTCSHYESGRRTPSPDVLYKLES